MSDNDPAEPELGSTAYELFIGALSILSLVDIVLLSVLRDQATQTVVYFLDFVLSVVFLIDFLVRLHRAPARSDYFFRQFGWADLAASLPFPQVKILRVFRLIRVARLLRRYGARNIAESLVRDRAGSALFTLLFIAFLVLQFGSLTMLYVERSAPDANIKTASDALWYVVVTISTVGYGDTYPVTTAGRELGSFIILVGVGIFGTLTGYLANLFLSPQKERHPSEKPSTAAEVRQRVEQVKELLRRQHAAVAELERTLGRQTSTPPQIPTADTSQVNPRTRCRGTSACTTPALPAALAIRPDPVRQHQRMTDHRIGATPASATQPGPVSCWGEMSGQPSRPAACAACRWPARSSMRG
jgi:voltage-gated potassium channel